MPTRDPEVGATAQVEMVVAEQDLASALNHITGDTYPPVFATTRAIALCELAAGRILAPLLADGELSVGVIVDVKHTAATPPGARVSATARYTGRDGRLYSFDVSVTDPGGEVMTGTHRRAVVQLARLLEGADKRLPVR
jgi:predicted thioesterase